MKKTIGMLAHVDAGKTTFSEQLLYHTNSIKNRGRVDHQDTFLDTHEIEKARGITVFADQAIFTYQNDTYYLIDTPGHVDFSPEMERAIQVMDYAVIIISAVEGVEGHTETVWQLLRKYQVPTFLFINKTDRVGADVERVMDEVRENLTEDVFELTSSLEENMKQDLVEFIAERNEELFEYYMEQGYNKDLWLQTLKTMVKQNQFYPCARGSALQDIGIDFFIEMFDQLTETTYQNEGSLIGRVYKIRYDKNGTRVTFIKALEGTVKVRDEVTYGNKDEQTTEKITQIRVYNGEKFQIQDQAEAGELFAVTGLSHADVGDSIGMLTEKATFEMVPTLKAKVIFDDSVHVKEALSCFKRLDAEDPSLRVIWDEILQEIHIHVMGTIQLEVLTEVVKERFGFNVAFEEPQIIYKETVNSTVHGYGHFEPLKHYAEVHLKIEPAPRNSGIHFENKCHADDLSVGNQNLIRHHVFEREHHGLLTGSALTDVKVTLLTGRAHNKHTSGGDFREATFRALRQGLEKAENVLLEPFYRFKIKVDIDQMGKVISDIQYAHGSFETPKTEGNKAIITGKAPVTTFMSYSTELAAFTQGKGMLNLVFAGYEACHNKEEVIERIDYNKNADPAYSSSSVFCSKGQGFSVPWDEAEAYMHALK